MIWHEASKTAVLTPPRCASRSIQAWLKAQPGWSVPVHSHSIDVPTLDGAKRVVVPVRNHWDALVSWNHANTQDDSSLTFKQWIRQRLIAGDSGVHTYTEMADGHCWLWRVWTKYATDIVRFEHLIEDLDDTLFDVIRDTAADALPHKGATERDPYPCYYDAEMAEDVRAFFRPEIEALGYRFNA